MSKTERRGKKKELNPASTSLFFNDSVLVRLSGVGDFVDVRFKVTPEMLLPGPIFIQDEKTGKVVTVPAVPKIGRLMTGKTKVDNTGFILFKNLDKLIKKKSLITLVIGQFKKEHIKITQ